MAAYDNLIKEMELRLGGGMVDVELDPEHYELAVNKSWLERNELKVAIVELGGCEP